MGSKRVEKEYKDIASKNSWSLIYQKIGQKCHSYPYTYIEAKKPQNKPLNRYRDVNPYDHSRIILKRSEKDYINANLVKVTSMKERSSIGCISAFQQMEPISRQYILTQGPLVFTVGHFWLMAWEQNSRAIIMLNKVIEKNELKCHWYWPHGVGEAHKMILGDVNLIIEQTSEVDYNYFVTRFFTVTDTTSNETREIVQFHYTTWPDFEVPSSPVAFLEFLKRVRASGALEDDVGPAIVHCSAGIGRSGTFCLVDYTLLLIEKQGQANVDIQEILLEMRKYRMGLIQTSEQLRFSYLAIIEGIKRLDPNYKGAKINLEESIYSMVARDDEEAPPPPPPRGESLGRPPARPLPAIPISASLGNINMRTTEESSSSDESPPTPPPRESSSPVSSADDEDEEPPEVADSVSTGEGGESLLRRRNREMSERIALIKKRSRDADRWHSLKRLKSEDKAKTLED